MKTLRVLVLTLLIAAFMAARPRPAAADDTTTAMLLGSLVGAGLGLLIYYNRDDSVRTVLHMTSQPRSREAALDFAPRPSRQAVAARNDRAAWSSGTILTF